MTWAELAHGLARGAHVAAVLSIFGTAVIRALVAPAALVQIQAEARRTIQRRLARLIWTSLIIAVVAGGLWLVLEASDLAPEPGFASILQTIPIVLLETHFGVLLMARLGILLIACLMFAMGRGTGLASVRSPLPKYCICFRLGLGSAGCWGSSSWST